MDCITIILIIVPIIVIAALFLCCMFTGKSVNIKGGHIVHEVEYKGQIIHIHMFEKLKEYLKKKKDMNMGKNTPNDEIHKEADEWVIDCIKSIKAEIPPQCTCKLGSIVDERIEKLIGQSNTENQANIDQNP